MPGKLLHQGCTIKCSLCQGAVTPVPPPSRLLKVQGNPVLLPTDPFTIDISKCLCKTTPPYTPCLPGPVTLAWTLTAQQWSIEDVPVLLQTSVGMFVGGKGAPIPVVIQDSPSPTQADAL